MTPKSKRPGATVPDTLAINLPRNGTTPTLGELLRDGTNAERREGIAYLGNHIRMNHPRFHPFPDDVREWLGSALEAIGRGADPKVALGLNSKRKHGVRDLKVLDYLVRDLRRKGMSLDAAESTIGGLRVDSNISDTSTKITTTSVPDLI